MTQAAHDFAWDVTASMTPEAAALALELARERLAAQLVSSNNLSQRVTALCALQFTAAAIAAGFAAAGHPARPFALTTGLAVLAFVAGAFLALGGVYSDRGYSPGLTPSFWTSAEPGLTLDDARAWTLASLGKAIEFNESVEARRGRWLNRSVAAGVCGAVMIAVVTTWRALS